MRNTQAIIGSSLVATVIALAGCDATMFANVNSSLTQFKTASKAAGSPVVPAAALAATAGGIELAKSMAEKSAGLIAAGGGNIIAAGGGNYALQAIENLQNANGVSEAQYEWETESHEGRVAKTKIKSFSCKSQGYRVEAKGSFTYTAAEATPANAYILFQTGAKGSFKAEMTGEVKYNDKAVVQITELTLNSSNPLPETGPLGSFVMESTATGDDYVKITANAELKNNVIRVSGKSKIGKNGPEKDITFDQDNPNGINDAAEGK